MTGWDKEYLHNKKDYLELLIELCKKNKKLILSFLKKVYLKN